MTNLTTPTRNDYWYGKRLTDYHMTLEQDFGAGKRSLINRFALGAGILTGLVVQRDRDGLLVQPGAALDHHGHEIVLPGPARISSEDLAGVGREALVIIERRDQPADPVQTFADTYTMNPQPMFDLVRETASIRVIPAPHLSQTQRPQCEELLPASPEPTNSWDQLAVLLARAPEPQLPSRPDAVVLARLHDDRQLGKHEIDENVRRHIPNSEVLLDIASCVGRRQIAPPMLCYVTGDNQDGQPGQPLDGTLLVRACEGDVPLSGWPVTFRVRGGRRGRVHDGSAWTHEFQCDTDQEGYAATRWQLGEGDGLNSVEVVAAYGSTVEFRALARKHDPTREGFWEKIGRHIDELVQEAEDTLQAFIGEGHAQKEKERKEQRDLEAEG